VTFLPVLLKDAAGDWYDMLAPADKQSWDSLCTKFKERFQDNDLLRWQSASKLWARDQEAGESVDQYVTALQNMAKRAGFNDDMLRYAVLRGIRRERRPHIIQSGAATLADVAEVAVGEQIHPASEQIMGKVLQEVGASRRVAEQNAADIQRLTAILATSTVK